MRRDAPRGGARPAGPSPWHVRLARLYAGTPGERARFILFVVLLTLVALCGGSSWPSAWQLLLLRPAAVLLATAILMVPGPLAQRTLRMPALLLAALAMTMAVQLIPLPPGLWTALPGHAPFAEAAAAAGRTQPWRPITLSVDLTLNSLVSLVVPAAVLLGAAALRPDQRAASAGLVVGLAVLSAIIGLFQVTLGPAFSFYAQVDAGRPAGLFVNINHQAAMLAAVLPVTAAWAVAPYAEARARAPVRIVTAAAAGGLLLAIILVSGSRSGLLLAAVAVVSVPLVIGDHVALPQRTRRRVVAGTAAAMAALVAATWLAGRLGALDRFNASAGDLRVAFLPITLGLLHGYMPFGSGFGTFDAVFRQAEPDAVLKLTYFNHAHNDLLELAITGGAAAIAVVLAYLAWLARRGVAIAGTDRLSPAALLARAGLCMVVVLGLASLADYPLRTPFAGALLALASLWIADRGIHSAE